MKQVFLILQIVIALFLIAAVSVQVKGGGFSRNFTAGSFTRRGLEKVVFRATFVIVFLFIIVSLLQLVA